jgi:hypothetical protein
MLAPDALAAFPPPLDSYPVVTGGLLDTLASRIAAEPFNLVATLIFLLAIIHTFSVPWFQRLAHGVQHRHDERMRRADAMASPSVLAEILHFFGEVEVVFGLWAIVLLAAITAGLGWSTATHYVGEEVNYTEPIFVVVIMALASTRPIVTFAESSLRHLANLGGGTPGAWWMAILCLGPLMGSLITEPAAMTICALLLARQFYDLEPSPALKYATLGLLFVNVSIGGALTHFAAPPVLMVAIPWGWDLHFMLAHFGWRAVLAILTSTSVYYLLFRRELKALAARPPHADVELPEDDGGEPVTQHPTIPSWITLIHMLFMVWTVATAHYPALFVGGFLFFLGFSRATAPYQSRVELKAPLLVGFFLAGLVIHGGLQGWWIAPVLGSLSERGLFLGATLLTAFNDNALITSLARLVPNLSDALKTAVVEGALTGGGLTVIANAPNPAGQALLARFFGGSIQPLRLLLAAAAPTVIAAMMFRLL